MPDLLTISQRTSFPPRVQKIKIQKKKKQISHFQKLMLPTNNGTMNFRSTTHKFKLLFVTHQRHFYFTSKVKLRLFYCHNFLHLWPQSTTLYTILGSKIMLPGLMVSYAEGKRMIIIYFYALKQRNRSVHVTYISADRCLWTVRTKI